MSLNRVTTCEACGKQVIYLPHVRTGKRNPIEYARAADGNVIPLDRDGDPTVIETAVSYRVLRKGEEWDRVSDGPTFVSHFARCEAAKEFRRTPSGAAR